MKKNEAAITLEIIFSCSPKKLWEALTQVQQMRKWYFENIEDFKAEVNFITSFDVHTKDKIFRHQWTVIEAINQKRLVYNWKYPDYEGDANVCFELSQIPEGTSLNFSMEILEDFDDGIPEFKREMCVGGWDYFLKDRLVNFLK